MANRWGKIERVTDCIFLGSKLTADGDCSHEIKRHLLLGRKAMTNLDSGNPLTLLVGMQTGTATMENSVEIS